MLNYLLIIFNLYLIDNRSDNEAVSISDSNDDSGLDVKSVNNIPTPSLSPTDDKSGWLKVLGPMITCYF